MTRLLVLSDTHGDVDGIRGALPLIHALKPLRIYHLGDFKRDAAFLRTQTDVPVIGVQGNCDCGGLEPVATAEDVEGVRIFLTHGHVYDVKLDTRMLTRAAVMRNCQVALYGHTHVPDIREEGGILLVNPGSLTQPRGGAQGSMALLMLEDGKAQATLLTV